MLEVIGVCYNNFKDVNLCILFGILMVVIGLSGCGKSFLIEDVLYNVLVWIMY